MAKTKNLLVQGWQGTLAKQVTFRTRNGKTVICAYPDMSKRELSEKQLAVNQVMADANYAARGIIANPVKRNEALIRLNITRNKLYTTLVKEYFAEHYKRDEAAASE